MATHICLENMNFMWDEGDLRTFRQMWKEGLSIQDMARAFHRTQNEVAILIMDQRLSGHIVTRPGGVDGNRKKTDTTHERPLEVIV